MTDHETPGPRPALPIAEAELLQPHVGTVFKLVINAFVRILRDRIAILIGSAFLLLLLWGTHGKIDVLGWLWDGWRPGSAAARATVIPGLPWDQEWISFAVGTLLLVAVPAILIRTVMRQRLTDYGLGGPLPGRGRLTILSAVLLFVVTLPAFYLALRDPGMRATYPLFRGFAERPGDFGPLDFALYELGYFAFFLVIEFVFRGYLLFGLFGVRDADVGGDVAGAKGPRFFGYYAVLLSMLSYTAWHLGKPVPELFGTLFWGVVAGTIVLATGTIWHVVIVHWLLNVVLDLAIWQGW